MGRTLLNSEAVMPRREFLKELLAILVRAKVAVALLNFVGSVGILAGCEGSQLSGEFQEKNPQALGEPQIDNNFGPFASQPTAARGTAVQFPAFIGEESEPEENYWKLCLDFLRNADIPDTYKYPIYYLADAYKEQGGDGYTAYTVVSEAIAKVQNGEGHKAAAEFVCESLGIGLSSKVATRRKKLRSECPTAGLLIMVTSLLDQDDSQVVSEVLQVIKNIGTDTTEATLSTIYYKYNNIPAR